MSYYDYQFETEVEVRHAIFPIVVYYNFDHDYDWEERRTYCEVKMGDFYCGEAKRKLSKKLRNEILKLYEDILIDQISDERLA